ncbi:1-phosphatidylinositol-4-phosphate 5-kinase [Rhizoctonia solani]|uniref:1-phosphatidylinositol-4-phosphate 5-kinase n=1 Tax=Rhizoctonia solani TaxID=456999 RepID=A0A0K6G6V8_9AGAM|nr:1-phosphatidylinositol-4-phosphate 5-kinase [Rhizoctonia solani]
MSTAILPPPKSIPLSPSDSPPGASHGGMSSPELTEVNPVHLMATAANNSREVHLERADSAQIVLRTGAQTDSLLDRAGHKLANTAHAVSAAVHPHTRSSDANKYGAMAVDSPRATSPTGLPFSDASGPVKKLFPQGPSFNPPPSPPASDEGSPREEDVMAALHAQPRSSSPGPKTSQGLGPSVSFDSGEPNVADGLLHPTRAPGPTRRNTTGALPAPAPRARKMTHSHSQSGGPSLTHARTRSQTMAGQDLHSDILKEAEQIRRERDSKRAKGHMTKEPEVGEKVLVGNLIGEGHTNYVLMYNMLNGIRVSVSRCQAKLKRPLTDEDFSAAHKFSFDTIGNELTPSAKYDFKFKDYAPWVFRSLREEHFALDPADYLVSLTGKYILSEVGSPGKSGSFFYYSRDYRFIIKTIHHAEHKFLRKILPQYYAHIASNPHTLLSRFYGLHRVKLPHGRKIHFVVMNNLFPAHLDIHETYDLKGSTVGREYDEAKARENPRAVLKDVNWIHRHKQLEFGPEKRAFLQAQLERDKQFLQTVGVMDYSLLVGIHNVKRGNRDNLRRNTLKVFSPTPRRQPSKAKTAKYQIQTTGTELAEQDLPVAQPEQQARFIFYADDGGYRATGEDNHAMGTVYYLGVIDILTPWNTKKKLEGIWKGLSADRHKISPVPSHEYGERFFAFLKAVMRGGEGGETFLPKEEREKDEKGKSNEQEREKPNGEPQAAEPSTSGQ